MGANCIVCGKFVATTDQSEHLRTNHLGPHYFWFDARKYRTERPSMTAAEIKQWVRQCDGTPSYAAGGYQLYMDKEDAPYGLGQIGISDSMAIDLTREPHFWLTPPATY